jgi:hypothetical protein
MARKMTKTWRVSPVAIRVRTARIAAKGCNLVSMTLFSAATMINLDWPSSSFF